MAQLHHYQCLHTQHACVHLTKMSSMNMHQLSKFRVQASRSSTTEAEASQPATAATAHLSPGQLSQLMPRQAVALFASGAVLGPFCDGLHSQHDVLHYVNPSVNLQLQAGQLQWSFETCWWVPLLFGIAGLIIGVSVPMLDEVLAGKQQQQQQQPQHHQRLADSPLNPSWAAVLVCIATFVTQYGLSGILEQTLLGQTLVNSSVPALDAILCTCALLHWFVFDKTPQGFGMAALTAVCGPLVEIGLINTFGLYHYSHPAVFGVPTWIPWVYFCGGPAVGNLGRKVWQQLKSSC